MSLLARYSRWALRSQKLHHSHVNTLSYWSSFSSSATASTPTRPSLPPIRVGLTQYAGRGVFASRRIGSGELIHTAQPVVSHPSFSSIHSVCYFCLRKLPNRVSSSEAPQTLSFCSKQCEEQSKKFFDVEKKADWSRFNEYCRLQGLKYPLLVKRLACQVISGAVSSDVLDILQPENSSSDRISKILGKRVVLPYEILKSGRSACSSRNATWIPHQYYGMLMWGVYDLGLRSSIAIFRGWILFMIGSRVVMSYDPFSAHAYVFIRSMLPSPQISVGASSSKEVKEMKNEAALLRTTFQESNIESEQLAFLTEEWYIGVLARIRINAFRIELAIGSHQDLLSSAAALVDAEAAVGNAVYVLPSLYNHDCDPNVNISWIENVDAKITALCDIEEGEELRICYIDASMDYEARQTILYEGFGFHCNCLRCVSDD